LLFYWGLAGANLLFLGLVCDALLKQQRGEASFLKLFSWVTLKLSCLGYILYSLVQVQANDFAAIMAGLASLVGVPIILGLWTSRRETKIYV